MSLLFETIRVEGGVLRHLRYHNARLNRSRRELLGSGDTLDLSKAVRAPADLGPGIFRCRIEYGMAIEAVSFTPYVRKPVFSLTLVDANGLEYAHKYTDRSGIERLLAGVGTDDILMVRGGLVTDTSIANIAFYDGERWVTPAQPLLAGTTRARLLDEGIIVAGEIRADSLDGYRGAVVFNAMTDFDRSAQIRIGDIRR